MDRVLIVGVGNRLMGDDALGLHALSELQARQLPDGVDTLEAGTALLDALPDLSSYAKVVFLDAVDGNGRTVRVLRDTFPAVPPRPCLSLHEGGIQEALRLQLLVDGRLPEIVVMGLAPKRIEMGMRLSDGVRSGIPELVEAVLDEVR